MTFSPFIVIFSVLAGEGWGEECTSPFSFCYAPRPICDGGGVGRSEGGDSAAHLPSTRKARGRQRGEGRSGKGKADGHGGSSRHGRG
ncbi:hypothetical protein C8R45DRAFT_973804 [Mycena sanguinolenta]|nr:hypothetical protein C8R45DRAFT_973804 [Mycena sanguinolenta]